MLAKSKLNKIEFSISKVLIDSNIIHDKFFLINNVLKEFSDMKEEIKNFYHKQTIYTKQFCLIVWSVEKIQKVKVQK